MLSRIADSIFWMSRYLERADNTARLAEINLTYLIEAEDVLPETAQWPPLLKILGSEDAFTALYGGESTASKVVQFLTRIPENPNSIRSCLQVARENARVVRDQISKEMWECMNELWIFTNDRLKEPVSLEAAPEFYGRIRREVARFHGLTITTMMRGEAYGFYSLGTFLERTDMTARILDVKYHLLLPNLEMIGSALDHYQWAALLKSLSGYEAYRKKFQSGLRPIDVAAFVILENDFPRSLLFCVDRLSQAFRKIGSKGPHSRTYKRLSQLAETLHDAEPDRIFSGGLHEFLTDFLEQICYLSDAVGWDYFEDKPQDVPGEMMISEQT